MKKKDDDHFGEIIAQGSQVVGPGSIHPDTGTKYEVVKDDEIATISRELVYSELMEYMPIAYPKRDLKTEIGDISVMDVLDKAGVQLRQVGSQLVCGHPIHGSTNDNNFVVNPDKNAWHCFRCDSGGGAIFLVAVLESIIECCDAKPGGLRDDKFKQTLNVAKEKYGFDIKDSTERDGEGSGQVSQSDKLLQIASEIMLFHDQDKKGFAFLNNEAIPLRSKKVKQWLAYKYFQTTGKPPNSDSLNQAIVVLEGKAIFECSQIKLFNRIASTTNVFWYDMGDGNAVRITAEKWTIVETPILFRRYSHQQAQSMPKSGGDPWKIFEFMNIDSKHQLLTLVVVISYFVPDIALPIFHPFGPQGAGKTTICSIIKKICDPSCIETLITPGSLPQLVQILAHHHVCLFDNLSDLPQWMSDVLAQACTGGGFSKRQLFTDDEDIIYKVKRCIGLNGINLTISKPDLMDRSILLHLERIDPGKRRDEKDLWNNFEQAKPSILGGILDTIVKSMKLYPDIRLEKMPRMADFAKWGVAIAEALGGRGNEFLESYQQNVARQNEEVIHENTLAQATLLLMSDIESWNGTVKSAWEKLKEIADPQKKDPTFPGSSRTLCKQLEKIKTNLMDIGITYRIGKRSKEGFPITFKKDAKFASFDTPSCNPLPDDNMRGEPKVNQTVSDKNATPSKSLHNKEVCLDEANEANYPTCWNDLTEVEI